jgi:hypothetical protein
MFIFGFKKSHTGPYPEVVKSSPPRIHYFLKIIFGRAIAQAVSRWLPTAAVRGLRTGRHLGFCGGQIGAGAGFLRVLRFPLPNSFHQLLQKTVFIIINQSIIGDM